MTLCMLSKVHKHAALVTAYMNLLDCLHEIFPTHKLVAYFRVVYNTSNLSAFDELLNAVYRIVISLFLTELHSKKLST